jgi:hypothetical protein
MYQALPSEVPLSQGDIVDGCPLFALEVSPPHVDLEAPPSRWLARVVVLTQDAPGVHPCYPTTGTARPPVLPVLA